MKKYLMTGIAAVAMCAAFTSCSKDVEPITQDQINQLEAEKVFQNYQKAFIATFGQPAANQTWGFKGMVYTRAENANANEWADPNKAYGGLLVPPPLTDEQIAVVTKYFQITKGLGYEDPEWENYFMQQVYKGHTSPREGYSPEAYLAANGSTELYASDYMDHLAAIDESRNFVDHINNFNHGDCSTNGSVLDNGGNANEGPFHSDKIMYMKESTTKSFGYYNSNGSVRRTEYTGLVSYKTIMNALGSEADCLEDGWNRSFMGFDFEQMVGPEIYAKELDYNAGWSADIPGGFPVKDYIWFEWGGQKYHMLVAEQNMYCGTPLEITDAQVQEDGFVDNLLAQGYLPVIGGAGKKWVKVGGCADGYYSDWIVCLTEAKTGGDIPGTTSLRVMAEDLSANEASDFDFNDVVLDFEGNEQGTEISITLQAAGGTLPLRINEKDDWEVHKLFGVATNVMVNTNAQAKGLNGDTKAPVFVGTLDISFTPENFCEKVNAIKIEVQKNGQWMELRARQGEACCKFACYPANEYKWVPERDFINNYYSFSDWVQGFSANLTKKINW